MKCASEMFCNMHCKPQESIPCKCSEVCSMKFSAPNSGALQSQQSTSLLDALFEEVFTAVQLNALQCSAVQCSAVQCSAVLCSSIVQCNAVQFSDSPSDSYNIQQWCVHNIDYIDKTANPGAAPYSHKHQIARTSLSTLHLYTYPAPLYIPCTSIHTLHLYTYPAPLYIPCTSIHTLHLPIAPMSTVR